MFYIVILSSAFIFAYLFSTLLQYVFCCSVFWGVQRPDIIPATLSGLKFYSVMQCIAVHFNVAYSYFNAAYEHFWISDSTLPQPGIILVLDIWIVY